MSALTPTVMADVLLLPKIFFFRMLRKLSFFVTAAEAILTEAVVTVTSLSSIELVTASLLIALEVISSCRHAKLLLSHSSAFALLLSKRDCWRWWCSVSALVDSSVAIARAGCAGSRNWTVIVIPALLGLAFQVRQHQKNCSSGLSKTILKGMPTTGPYFVL